MQFQSTLYGACQNDLGDHCSILRGGIWNGTLTVLYDYTELVTDPNPDPHPVPTPAPLSLAAAGFLAWAVGGRRRPRDALRC
jgi:hypothetical protein